MTNERTVSDGEADAQRVSKWRERDGGVNTDEEARKRLSFIEKRDGARDHFAEIALRAGENEHVRILLAWAGKLQARLDGALPSVHAVAAAENAIKAAALLDAGLGFRSAGMVLNSACLLGAADALLSIGEQHRSRSVRGGQRSGGGAKAIVEELLEAHAEASGREIADMYAKQSGGQTVTPQYVNMVRRRKAPG